MAETSRAHTMTTMTTTTTTTTTSTTTATTTTTLPMESRHKKRAKMIDDNDEKADWNGRVFSGDLLRPVCDFLSFRDCCRAARTCQSFSQMVKFLRSEPPTRHRWFAAHPCLSRVLTLEPPTFLFDGEDGNEKNYVGDMIYLGVFLENSVEKNYSVEEMDRIVQSQGEAYPWFDNDAPEKMRLLPSGRTDTALAKMLCRGGGGTDAEVLHLWVAAAGLPNPRLQAAFIRFGESRTTETGGFESYRIFLDRQSADTRIPHVEFVGEPRPNPASQGTVEIYYEGHEEAFDLFPFLLLACSRAQLLERVHPEQHSGDSKSQEK